MAVETINRRQALQSAALGFGGLALSAMCHQLQAQDTGSAPFHFAPRAKRVIFMFMKGGPSQVDTFDYKPKLQQDDGKALPFAKPRVQFAPTGNLLGSPWRFRQYGDSGIHVSDLFPHVAQCVDDMCFLNSVHGTNAAHGGAALKLHTGSDNFVRPSMGAWVSYGLGTENSNLPSFVTICPTLAHGGRNNWGSAFLPARNQGIPLGVASQPATAASVRYISNPKWSAAAQRVQLDLLKQANERHLLSVPEESTLEARIQSYELAFRMQTEMPRLQDLSLETQETQDLYGLNDKVTENFARQCLMARRFAEAGVRFIQVTHSDAFVQWDQHGDLRKGHSKNAAEVDKPIAGLLRDLRSRGMLDDTLVIWGGEFGRTPTAQGKDGRDHNPEGFTMWLAGGGVKSGFAYGATDDYGFFAVDEKVHIHDFHATILALLGIHHEQLTFRHSGRDFRLTDVSGRVVSELFA